MPKLFYLDRTYDFSAIDHNQLSRWGFILRLSILISYQFLLKSSNKFFTILISEANE